MAAQGVSICFIGYVLKVCTVARLASPVARNTLVGVMSHSIRPRSRGEGKQCRIRPPARGRVSTHTTR